MHKCSATSIHFKNRADRYVPALFFACLAAKHDVPGALAVGLYEAAIGHFLKIAVNIYQEGLCDLVHASRLAISASVWHALCSIA